MFYSLEFLDAKFLEQEVVVEVVEEVLVDM
jgi:hypothetical protein